MDYKYIIYTSIFRNFDPYIEGLTLDSIAETCPGYVNHTIPLFEKLTRIHLTLDRIIDGEPKEYLVGQLEENFGEENLKIILGIVEDRR